jgi:hypothetical protein
MNGGDFICIILAFGQGFVFEMIWVILISIDRYRIENE